MRAAVRLALVIVLTTVGSTLGCASSGGTVVVDAVPGPERQTPPGGTVSRGVTGGWRLDTREHVDLWLHGFAMLQDDSSLVPYFRLGYRASFDKLRPAGLPLDANRARLHQRVAENPNLTSAQFLALYFGSWDDLKRGVDRFLRVSGDVRAARSQEELRMFATIRTYFPTMADREWLQTFVGALDDERSRFYRAYWLQQGQLRAPVRSHVDALWSGTYRAAFARFMNNAMQREGSVLLSLPLGGEGRTLAAGGRDNFVSVTFPTAQEDPRSAIFVIAHEIVGSVAANTVRDNTSAADQRSGEAAKWTTLAAVRGGAMLLERVAPELLKGYQEYYLRVARQNPVASDLGTRFAATFPLPDNIRDALQRQIEAVLGGI